MLQYLETGENNNHLGDDSNKNEELIQNYKLHLNFLINPTNLDFYRFEKSEVCLRRKRQKQWL